MTDRPNIQNLLRPREQYSTHELSAYAREILITRDYPDTREPYSKRLTTNWETSDYRVDMTCQNTEEEFPTYQLNVRNKTSVFPEEHAYTVNEKYPYVGLYHVNLRDNTLHKVEHPSPQELAVEVMRYLRERPSVYPPEPRNNVQTERAFRTIMVNLAIDTAIRNGEIDLWEFVGEEHFTDANQRAIDTVLDQSLIIDYGLSFPYTRMSQRVGEELGLRVSRLTANRQIEP
tara:strand:- start:4148 stop:4840 length:693 start_codon:yes stop_codon:yes gene_type:complete